MLSPYERRIYEAANELVYVPCAFKHLDLKQEVRIR